MNLRRAFVPASTFQAAKINRTNPTQREAELWERLRGHGVGARFRRQIVIAGFIVDFWCPQRKLAVEIDGPSHDPVRDHERDQVLRELGITTLRFPVEWSAAEMRDKVISYLAGANAPVDDKQLKLLFDSAKKLADTKRMEPARRRA